MGFQRTDARRSDGLEGLTADDAWADKPHDLRLYRFLQVTLGPVIRLAFRVDRKSLTAIPTEGPVILVTNHVSYLDPTIIVGSIHRPIFHFGKHTLFKKGFRRWLFLHGGGQIPVDRGSPAGNEAAFRAAVRALEKGAAFGVYPEAHRSPDGRLRRGKSGVGRLALTTGAPCYPVAVAGTFEAWPKGQRFPKLFRRTRILVGAPRVFPKDPMKAEDRAEAQKVTDLLMADLAKLLGQPYDPRPALPPDS